LAVGGFFDVSPIGQTVWIKYLGGKKELSLSDYSVLAFGGTQVLCVELSHLVAIGLNVGGR